MDEKQVCPHPGPVMMGINRETKKGRIWRPPCKSWSCPVCQEQRAREWGFVALVGAVELAKEHCRLIFVTVTSHEKLSAAATIAVWPSAWKKLHTRIVREFGKGQYFMVTERHKSGRLHVHAIVTWPMDEAWLRKNARSCGLGYMIDCQHIDDAGIVVSYVAKYLTKFEDTWPKRWRRVRMSRGWPKLPDIETNEGWQDWMMGNPKLFEIEAAVRDYASAGYEVNVASDLLDSFK